MTTETTPFIVWSPNGCVTVNRYSVQIHLDISISRFFNGVKGYYTHDEFLKDERASIAIGSLFGGDSVIMEIRRFVFERQSVTLEWQKVGF